MAKDKVKQCVSMSAFGSMYYLLGAVCLTKQLSRFDGDIVIHTDQPELMKKIIKQEEIKQPKVIIKGFKSSGTLKEAMNRFMTTGYDIYHVLDSDSSLSPQVNYALNNYNQKYPFYTCHYHLTHKTIMAGAVGYNADTARLIRKTFKNHKEDYSYGFDERLLSELFYKVTGLLYSGIKGDRLGNCITIEVPSILYHYRNTYLTFKTYLKYYNDFKYEVDGTFYPVDTKPNHG